MPVLSGIPSPGVDPAGRPSARQCVPARTARSPSCRTHAPAPARRSPAAAPSACSPSPSTTRAAPPRITASAAPGQASYLRLVDCLRTPHDGFHQMPLDVDQVVVHVGMGGPVSAVKGLSRDEPPSRIISIASFLPCQPRQASAPRAGASDCNTIAMPWHNEARFFDSRRMA